MAQTKQLALNTVPQNIVVQSVCTGIILKEDESVLNWPTTGFTIKKPSTGDANFITKGHTYTFTAPVSKPFHPGMILGTIALPTGSTTGIQDEQ